MKSVVLRERRNSSERVLFAISRHTAAMQWGCLLTLK